MTATKGFSIIEVLLAAAIFITLVSGVGTLVISGLIGNRISEEQTIATNYATEGLEAVLSIKNQDYANLVNTSGTGVDISGSNVWIFSGINNAFGKYNRTISIEDVQRDGSGNIVVSGGTIDPDTKLITSTISWAFNSTRNKTLALTTYLTNFKKAIINSLGGLILYSDGGSTPISREYDGSTRLFGNESNTVSANIGRSFVIRTSPTQHEAIAGYVNSAGTLQVVCYDGTTWSNEWSVSVGGTATTRRFDIAYETNSGDVVVLYSRNVATTNELGYRTKSGTSGCGTANWSASSNLNPVRTSGTVHWVKMAWDRRTSSNLITTIWADSNRDLSTMVWNGSAWGNEPSSARETTLHVVSTAQDIDNFDVAYESLSGDVMVVWGNSVTSGNNGVRYSTCTGGTATCTWSAVLTPPTFADDAANLSLAPNLDTDQLAFASIGTRQRDLQIGYWTGTAWQNRANVDTSAGTPLAGTKLVAVDWLINDPATRYIVVYMDSDDTGISWYIATPGSAPIAQTDITTTPSIGNPKKWIDMQVNPSNKNQLVTIISDENSDLFAKNLQMDSSAVFTWDDTLGGSALETVLTQATTSPYSFAFWRY